jgi:parvulin-like peptidyl-prolyl isomerase
MPVRMRLQSKLKWVLAVGVVAALISPAAAQQGGSATGGAGTPPPATVPFTNKPALTPPEQLAAAQQMVSQIESSSASVRKQLQAARERRDVVATLCQNDKLNQMDTAAKVAKERAANLKLAVEQYNKAVAEFNAALKAQNQESATHEFTILKTLLDRVQQLNAESNQCIGEEAAFVGQTAVTTQIDPNLPPSDDTQFPTPTNPTLVEPPQCTSCTL